MNNKQKSLSAHLVMRLVPCTLTVYCLLIGTLVLIMVQEKFDEFSGCTSYVFNYLYHICLLSLAKIVTIPVVACYMRQT